MQILFLGTHGQFNIGDELLLETFLAQLGRENKYAVNSYDPTFTQNAMRPKFNIESFHTTRELPRFLKYLLTSDLLFFGGGSIIKELYASVGRNPYSTLLMILATVTFAKQIARKKVVMSNIGVGPLMTPNGERLARWILNQVDVLSVRDETSHQTALKLGLPPNKIQLVPDAVFANSPEIFLVASHTLPLTIKMEADQKENIKRKKYKDFSWAKPILIVEDNLVNRDLVTMQLQRFGVLSKHAGNGQEALELLHTTPDAFSLVLMDIHMPVMDGLTASRLIRQMEAGSTQHIPIIAVTANTQQGSQDLCFSAGMDDFIGKPVALKDIDDLLSKWLVKESI